MRQSARKYRFRKAIQSVLNVEQKFHRIMANGAVDSSNEEIIVSTSLNLIPRGAGPSERIGTQVAVNAIKAAVFVSPHVFAEKGTGIDNVMDPLNATVTTIATDTITPVYFEIWIDTQPEAGAITNLDVLYQDDGSVVFPYEPWAFRNRDNTSRYRKLKTFAFNLQCISTNVVSESGNADNAYIMTWSGGGVRKYKKTFKKPLVIKFDPSDDATPTVGNVMNRNLFLIARRPRTYPPIHYDWQVQLDYTDV
jgi:hypothetical protein